jgi:hypothetical protein
MSVPPDPHRPTEEILAAFSTAQPSAQSLRCRWKTSSLTAPSVT